MEMKNCVLTGLIKKYILLSWFVWFIHSAVFWLMMLNCLFVCLFVKAMQIKIIKIAACFILSLWLRLAFLTPLSLIFFSFFFSRTPSLTHTLTHTLSSFRSLSLNVLTSGAYCREKSRLCHQYNSPWMAPEKKKYKAIHFQK